MTFETLGLQPALLRGVRSLGFTTPTPIQSEAVPVALAGRDVLACAMTGSGKTAAFLLPVLDRLLRKRGRGPRALVITPTRELAAQVADDMKDLAVHLPLSGAAIFGGVGMGPQERALRHGTDVIVATPGRLLDHLGRPYARLDTVEVLVLDEADRMLDMGFLPDVRRILRRLPMDRQTLLFSATMPPPIAKLAEEMLRDPVRIAVGRPSTPASGIRHQVFAAEQGEKSRLLLEILARKEVRSVLAFTRTKHRANRLTAFLQDNGVAAERIHGNRSQAQRQKALDAFRSGCARILVATDVAARGIDIDDLSHVVNFDVPHVVEDYIHRVGRTARAGRSGYAFTFVAPDERADLRAIEKALGRRLEHDRPARREHPSTRGPAPHRAASPTRGRPSPGGQRRGATSRPPRRRRARVR